MSDGWPDWEGMFEVGGKKGQANERKEKTNKMCFLPFILFHICSRENKHLQGPFT